MMAFRIAGQVSNPYAGTNRIRFAGFAMQERAFSGSSGQSQPANASTPSRRVSKITSSSPNRDMMRLTGNIKVTFASVEIGLIIVHNVDR